VRRNIYISGEFLMSQKPSVTDKLTSDHLPFLIMGIGLSMLVWVFGIGDFFIA
jgi:uncharacterized RDD family membrane protein YckC